MIIVFYIFAPILIWFSFKSLLGGIRYLRFFKTELAKPRSGYTPFVTVIAPCRGVDDGLKLNLAALFDQNYPDYEVVFVVDDAADPAVPIINEVIRKAAKDANKARLVIAPAADGCSQKVANLREAVLHASDTSEAFVFVDSDARPSPEWLRALVAPLSDEKVGAATGYRWFIPANPTFASELRSAWNASVASALGPYLRSNFCWGGSMAIRRDVFERLGIRDRWSGTLSDDYTVTRIMIEKGLPIIFVPQALAASVEDCGLRELFEFTTRQMKITRVYAPRMWVMSLVGSTLFNGVMISALLIIIFSGHNDTGVYAAAATITLVTIFSIGKAWLRFNAVRLVLAGYDAKLRRQFLPQITLWALAPAVYLFNGIAAGLSRQLTWRGTTYELKSPSETVIIAD